MNCCVHMVALRASWPSSRVHALACTAMSCCCGVAPTGLFGFSVSPGPVSQLSQPATPSRASESPTVVRTDLFIFDKTSDRLFVEGDGHDVAARQRGAEPVDAAVGVLRATDADFRIETAVVRPQSQVASRQLEVHCGRAADHLHPVLAERVAERDLAQTRMRAVFEARADRATRGALTAARRAAVEPVLTDGDGRVGAR